MYSPAGGRNGCVIETPFLERHGPEEMQMEIEVENTPGVSAHTVVEIPILEGAIGMSLPFLFIDNGVLSMAALAWARARMLNDTRSPVTLTKGVEAVGRFYDFYVCRHAGEALTEQEFRLLLEQFYEARKHGFPPLGWKTIQIDTAKDDVRAVSEFSKWCSENYGFVDINPNELNPMSELSSKERYTHNAIAEHRKNWDLLYHLRNPAHSKKDFAKKRAFNPDGGKRKAGTRSVKNFPPDKVWPFIQSATCVRDKLYFLLMFFGATRISEPLHLFATDVSILPDGTAKVVLAHPQFGVYFWTGIDKRTRVGSRAAFLAERYAMGARNLLGAKHPLRAGWKGMALYDGKLKQSEVIWLDPKAGQEFARLHIEYMSTVRSKVPDVHPFYFINEKGDNGVYGAPLKLSNISKSFYRNVERIGLTPGEPGIAPHGSRHFCGFYGANVLQISIELMQRILRHEQSSSTEVYYRITDETARKEIQKSHEQHPMSALLPKPMVLK